MSFINETHAYSSSAFKTTALIFSDGIPAKFDLFNSKTIFLDVICVALRITLSSILSNRSAKYTYNGNIK